MIIRSQGNRYLAKLLFGLMMAPTVLMAESAHDLESIRSEVIQFTEQLIAQKHNQDYRSQIEIRQIDPRLKLSQCADPLHITQPYTQNNYSRFTVKVSCTTNEPWSLYVPVKISLFANVLVSSRPLSRNEVLSAHDLEWQEKDVSQLNFTYMSDIESAIGKQLKRPLRINQVILSSHLELPKVVKKGDTVSIHANSKYISIEMLGTALSDGAAGDQISVKNTTSQKVINARIIAPGQVEVTL